MSRYPMHQCKIFVSGFEYHLESLVNEWFLNNPNVFVSDVIYKHNTSSFSVFILYDPVTGEE